MPPNYVHKIVHISTLFYQCLSIISASGRKLLKMKNSKSFFLHLVHVCILGYNCNVKVSDERVCGIYM